MHGAQENSVTKSSLNRCMCGCARLTTMDCSQHLSAHRRGNPCSRCQPVHLLPCGPPAPAGCCWGRCSCRWMTGMKAGPWPPRPCREGFEEGRGAQAGRGGLQTRRCAKVGRSLRQKSQFVNCTSKVVGVARVSCENKECNTALDHGHNTHQMLLY